MPDQLAPPYERAMSKYPLGQYRDRVGTNIEMVYQKMVKKGSPHARGGWGQPWRDGADRRHRRIAGSHGGRPLTTAWNAPSQSSLCWADGVSPKAMAPWRKSCGSGAAKRWEHKPDASTSHLPAS
jgi:hypothetical protein